MISKYFNWYATYEKEWTEEYGVAYPTETCCYYASALISFIAEKYNIEPQRVSPSIEEGVFISYRQSPNELIFEVYNEDLGIGCVFSHGKKIIGNHDINHITEVFPVVEQYLKYIKIRKGEKNEPLFM